MTDLEGVKNSLETEQAISQGLRLELEKLAGINKALEGRLQSSESESIQLLQELTSKLNTAEDHSQQQSKLNSHLTDQLEAIKRDIEGERKKAADATDLSQQLEKRNELLSGQNREKEEKIQQLQSEVLDKSISDQKGRDVVKDLAARLEKTELNLAATDSDLTSERNSNKQLNAQLQLAVDSLATAKKEQEKLTVTLKAEKSPRKKTCTNRRQARKTKR